VLLTAAEHYGFLFKTFIMTDFGVGLVPKDFYHSQVLTQGFWSCPPAVLRCPFIFSWQMLLIAAELYGLLLDFN
jgi:hypothetical protein